MKEACYKSDCFNFLNFFPPDFPLTLWGEQTKFDKSIGFLCYLKQTVYPKKTLFTLFTLLTSFWSSLVSFFFSGSGEVAEDLPYVHQADGAGLQVQRTEAARDLRYHRAHRLQLHFASLSPVGVEFSVWVALVTDLLTCLQKHSIFTPPTDALTAICSPLEITCSLSLYQV